MARVVQVNALWPTTWGFFLEKTKEQKEFSYNYHS